MTITALPALSRRDDAISRIRASLPQGVVPTPSRPPARAAETIAASVSAAVDGALSRLAPYGSRGDAFEAVADIEHVDRDGTTRVRLQFAFNGGARR